MEKKKKKKDEEKQLQLFDTDEYRPEVKRPRRDGGSGNPIVFHDYESFVAKFKDNPKTTDDCYTPPEVYDAVLGYCVERFGVDPAKAVRPFYPGGDYEAFEYQQGCCVVDNPPFSILSKIVDFYVSRSVPFFLFAPSLTCFGPLCRHLGKVTALLSDSDVTYENGARVRTAFLTSLLPGVACESEPGLGRLVGDAADAAKARMGLKIAVSRQKYVFPDSVLTAARLQWIAGHGEPLRVMADECVFISKLDAMRSAGKPSIFGGGLLLSRRAAAERAAAERAAAERAAAHMWALSEHELALQEMLS